MKVEIRGIIQWWDKGVKLTKIVYRRDDQYGRHSMMLPDDVKVSKGRVVDELAKFVESPSGDILIPRHIRPEDIEELDKK